MVDGGSSLICSISAIVIEGNTKSDCRHFSEKEITHVEFSALATSLGFTLIRISFLK